MLQYIRDLHLERMINILMIIQCVGIVWMTFLFARGDMYSAAILQWINGLVFIGRYGKVSDFFETRLSKLFFIFVVIEIIAFVNYLFDFSLDTSSLGGLFYHASLPKFFCYSLVWYLNYVFFYIYTQKSDSIDLLKIFAVLYFIAGVLNNYRAHTIYHIQDGRLEQLNYFYYALVPLPFMFFFIKGKIRYLLLLIVLSCVIYGYKRSGIFACGLIFLLNFFIENAMNIKKVLWNSLLIISLLFAFSYYMENNKALERTQTRLERLEDDGGSGRTGNMERVLKRVETAPAINQIFGHGFMGQAARYRKMVDVEIAAILYYYGLAGWIVYLMIHIWLIRKIIFMYKNRVPNNPNVLYSYVTCYSILFFYSIAAEPFSYLYFFCLIFVYLGFIESYLAKHHNLL